FTVGDFGFSDIDGNTLQAVKITTLPVVGTLTNNGVAVTAGNFIPVADITGGHLAFTPAANANGTGYASFTFQVQDIGGTGNGGVDTDPSANTITINVTSVNDAPSGADKTVSTNEDTAYAFTAGDFGFSDIDGNTLQAVKITTLPVAGTLTNNGVAVTAGSSIPIADITGGHLVFTPAANANGTGYASFTFQVQDIGGTGNGGVDTDPSANTVTINVTSVNDAPVATITPASYIATEQVALSLKNSGLSISDVDAGASPVTVTLSVGEGTLTVTAGTSGALVSGSGNPSVTINGTVAQINALLNPDGTSAVSYLDNTDTPGSSTTLTLSVNDNGNSGTGGSLIGSDSATINITAVNDAPTLTEAAGLGTQAVPVSVFGAANASAIEAGQTIKNLTFTVSGLADGANEKLVVDGTAITLGGNSSGTTATNAMNYVVTVAGGTATIALSSSGGVSSSAINTLIHGITYQDT